MQRTLAALAALLCLSAGVTIAAPFGFGTQIAAVQPKKGAGAGVAIDVVAVGY